MSGRFINYAYTITDALPQDYFYRWDASRIQECPIGFNTNEATNDVNSWADETGNLTLDSLAGTGTYPAFLYDADGYPHIRFYAGRSLYKAYDASVDGAADITVFSVTRTDSANQGTGNRYIVGGPSEFHVGHESGSSNPPGFLEDGTWNSLTNNFDDRRLIMAYRNVYNGAADNDVDVWCGTTNKLTQTTQADANGVGFLTMGSYSSGTTWLCDGNVYEYVVFRRALTATEVTAWVRYLSAKWQCHQSDSASDTAYTDTAKVWESTGGPDKSGQRFTITRDHTVRKKRDQEGPRRRATSGTTSLGSYSYDDTAGTPDANGEAEPNANNFDAVTSINFYDNDGAGTDRSPTLLALRKGDYLLIDNNELNFWRYRVTGTPTDNTTYVTVPVEFFGGNNTTYPQTTAATAVQATDKSRLDTNFPITMTDGWVNSPTLKYWFDAAVTGGMTFATGDAISGGTVSSWIDITGSVTMDTTTSGDSAVDYNPKAIRGRPSITGGTTGTPKSLESTANVTYSTGAGDERLFWAVINVPNSAGDQAPCGWFGNIVFPGQQDTYDGDLYTGVNHPTLYLGSATTGVNKQPLSTKDLSVGFHIIVGRVTINGTNGDLESWYAGLKGPDRVSSSADGASNKCSVGALATSNYDSDGHCFEFGAMDSTVGFSDAEIDTLIRYLCEKYGVDYMPDTTPLDVGLFSRSTTTVADTDCCLWYRADDAADNKWPLVQECADLHTTPANFDMSPGASSNAGDVQTDQIGRKSAHFDDANTEGWLQETNYNMSETTDFPATTDGASLVGIGRLDQTNCPANGYLYGAGTVGAARRFSTNNTFQHFVGNTSKTSVGATDDWVILAGAYTFTAATGDADPDCEYWENETAKTLTDGGAYESFSNIQISGGHGSAESNYGAGWLSEVWIYKHPIIQSEYDQLLKYARYRYNDPFD